MNRAIVTKKTLKQQEKPVEKTRNQEKLLELIDELPSLNKIKEGEKKDVLLESEKESGNTWLESQVISLSEENETLKKELVMYKEQYNVLLQNRPVEEPMMFISPDEENIKREVMNLFRELENQYFGKNPQKQVYKLVKVEHLLTRMNSMFPFLRPS